MKNKLLAALLLSLLLKTGNAAYDVSVFIRNMPVQTVKMTAYFGEKKVVIDSLKSTPDGKVTFQFTDEHATGLYSFVFKQNNVIDFIFNRENILIYSTWPQVSDSITVVTSTENTLYYDFIKNTIMYQRKINLLYPLMDYYPDDDPFYPDIIAEYNSTDEAYRKYYDSLLTHFSNTYAARIIRLKRPMKMPPDLDEQKRFEYLRDHYFEGISLDDPELLKSDSYTRMMIDYMSLYGNPNFNQEQLEDALIKSVGIILDNAQDNKLVHDFVVEYLVKGFEKYHFDKVLEFLSVRLADEEQCENTDDKSTLNQRLEQYAKLASGKPSPSIAFLNDQGEQVRLENITSEYTLVVFWASWCPHCIEMLPELKKIYDRETRIKFEVLSISLDTARTEYQNYITKHNINWITHCEFKGWTGKIVTDFNIYATPTMFLLDRNKMILAKPISLSGLKQELSKIGISSN